MTPLHPAPPAAHAPRAAASGDPATRLARWAGSLACFARRYDLNWTDAVFAIAVVNAILAMAYSAGVIGQ